MIIIAIFLLVLYIDARRYRKTHHIKKVEHDENNKNIYVATEDGRSPHNQKNYKVMVLLHSLHCEKCNSENIKIEITPDNQHVRVICFDCGFISKISLKSIIP